MLVTSHNNFFFCYQHQTAGLAKNLQETNSLCGVFRYGEQSQNHEKQLKLGSTNTASENHIHTTQSVVPNADNSIGQSSTSQPQVCQPQLPGLDI